MLLNCGVGEDSWESHGLQGDPTSPSWRRSVLNIHWKDWCWSWNSNNLTTWYEELTHWKRPWCWERLKEGREGDNRGWMVGCHHQLDGHEFEQALGVGDGQGSLVCCSPWGHKEVDMTEWLNWKCWNQQFSLIHLIFSDFNFLKTFMIVLCYHRNIILWEYYVYIPKSSQWSLICFENIFSHIS